MNKEELKELYYKFYNAPKGLTDSVECEQKQMLRNNLYTDFYDNLLIAINKKTKKNHKYLFEAIHCLLDVEFYETLYHKDTVAMNVIDKL